MWKPLIAWTAAVLRAALLFAAALLFPLSLHLAVQTISAVSATVAPHDPEGRTTILLLGIGDRTHAAADLTDAMILASIDPRSESLVLLSIPRDLYLTESADLGAGRINGLYAGYKRTFRAQSESGVTLRAMRAVADEVGGLLHVPIQGVMSMDFTGFTNTVDALGGVDVTVPKDIVDQTYPLEEGVVGTFAITAGPHHLNGETALRYARSRHSTSDFDRSLRQQQILSALLERVRANGLTGNLDRMPEILDGIDGHFVTTFSRPELAALVGLLLPVRREGIVAMHLSTRRGGDRSHADPGGFLTPRSEQDIGTGALLFPSDDPSDWTALQSLADLLVRHRDLYLARPVFTIIAAPAQRVQARRLENALLRHGFSAGMREGETSDFSFIDGGTQPDAVLRDLATLLRLPRVDPSEEHEDIRIILGKGYRFGGFSELRL